MKLSVNLRRRPQAPPMEMAQPGLGEAMTDKYEVENYRDIKQTLRDTDIGMVEDKQGNTVADPLEEFFKQHVLVTQGGGIGETAPIQPDQEWAWHRLGDWIRFARRYGDEKLLVQLLDILKQGNWQRYDQSHDPAIRKPKAVVVIPPMINPMAGQNTVPVEVVQQQRPQPQTEAGPR